MCVQHRRLFGCPSMPHYIVQSKARCWGSKWIMGIQRFSKSIHLMATSSHWCSASKRMPVRHGTSSGTTVHWFGANTLHRRRGEYESCNGNDQPAASRCRLWLRLVNASTTVPTRNVGFSASLIHIGNTASGNCGTMICAVFCASCRPRCTHWTGMMGQAHEFGGTFGGGCQYAAGDEEPVSAGPCCL